MIENSFFILFLIFNETFFGQILGINSIKLTVKKIPIFSSKRANKIFIFGKH